MSMTIEVRKLIFLVLFLLLPIADAFNGFLIYGKVIGEAGLFSPSQLARLFASMLMLYVIFVDRLSVVPILLCLYLFVVEIVSGFIHQSSYGVAYGMVVSYKLIYIILTSTLLLHYTQDKEGRELLCRFVKYNITFIAAMLYFSSVTRIGIDTYSGGFGTKSFFASGNGLGLYLGIGGALLLGMKHYGYLNISNGLLLFVILSEALIGTKTSFILCLVNLTLFALLSKYRYAFIIFSIGLFLFGLHYLIDTLSVVFDVIIRRYENSASLIEFMGSGRIKYVEDALNVYLSQSPGPLRLLFGLGAFTSFQDPSFVYKFDTLETDLFDIFFMYGLVFSGILMFVYIYVIFRLRFRKLFVVGMVLLVAHSIVAGHVVMNGMSSLLIALYVSVAYFPSNSKASNA